MADKGRGKVKENLKNLDNSVESVLAKTVADIAGRAIKPELQPFAKKINEAVEAIDDLIEEVRDIKHQQTSEMDNTRGAISNLADQLEKLGSEVKKNERWLVSILEQLKMLDENSNSQKSRLKTFFIVTLIFNITLTGGMAVILLMMLGT